ncbi:DNA-binding transcriptional activator DecR [Sinobacterium norvegicum]|uniref:DNA-binding transcriptional activator DecR n=1 Tax=Sinobacterium norvegicum TaxID=1641715 RepID=A0ABN8EKY1_9GAMM|nr:Lrp/AsnC family transcriptional regulator [Sinobacterium norvegicum]CAH0993016.1 DNA-binding transcriptional activator DecR [Sinobacterium norvegicum]
MIALDKVDRKILNLLQQDATISLAALAEKVNLSTTPCWKRVKRLEDEKIIAKRVALVNPEKAQLPTSVFMTLAIVNHSNRWIDGFTEVVSDFDEVMEVYRMTGEFDYMLRIQVKDIQAFDRFYKQLMEKVDGITKVTSSFAMETIKYTTALPV